MNLRHQVFWNIPWGPVIFYSLTIIAWAILIFAIYRRAKLWSWGKGKEPPAGRWWNRLKAFIKYFLIDLLLHRRFFQDIYPAIIHFSLFLGFFLLLLGTIAGSIDHYVFPFLKDRVYLVVSLILDLAGVILLLGVALAVFRRYIQRPSRLDNRLEDSLALLWLSLMAITGFLIEGARLAIPEPGGGSPGSGWMPAGSLASRLFLPLNQESKETWHRLLWWFHSGLGLIALVYVALSFNRLIHILISAANVFLRPLGYKGALHPVNLDSDQKIGVGEVQDFTWKHLLELDACTRCGRCQDNCPAYTSNKLLSPKKVIQDLKVNWLDKANSSTSKEQEVSRELIPDTIPRQVIWDCTTCFACHQQCPVYVQPMYKIMEMRRFQAMMLGQLPPSAQAAIQNMQKRGHPWAGSQFLRLRDDWTKEVSVRKIKPGEKIKTLLFAGCTGALVDRNVAVTLSVVRLLNKAGIEFGVLGGAEACCGDPARRLGYELLYRSMAQVNIEAFKEHGINQIITTCPHCYNTFKNEYAEFGGNFSVFHHSEILADLLQKRIIKGSPSKKKFAYTYHDACYLGRYNDIFSAPRKALQLAIGEKPREMALSKSKSFCCGGGGGHAWLEEVGERRINELRLEQALIVGASSVTTACPYCLQMLENALEKRQASPETKNRLQILDIAEIIEKAIDY